MGVMHPTVQCIESFCSQANLDLLQEKGVSTKDERMTQTKEHFLRCLKHGKIALDDCLVPYLCTSKAILVFGTGFSDSHTFS